MSKFFLLSLLGPAFLLASCRYHDPDCEKEFYGEVPESHLDQFEDSLSRLAKNGDMIYISNAKELQTNESLLAREVAKSGPGLPVIPRGHRRKLSSVIEFSNPFSQFAIFFTNIGGKEGNVHGKAIFSCGNKSELQSVRVIEEFLTSEWGFQSFSGTKEEI